MAKFFAASNDDKNWYEECGLKSEEAVSVIKDSIKQWNEVYKITTFLKEPENQKIR